MYSARAQKVLDRQAQALKDAQEEMEKKRYEVYFSEDKAGKEKARLLKQRQDSLREKNGARDQKVSDFKSKVQSEMNLTHLKVF